MNLQEWHGDVSEWTPELQRWLDAAGQDWQQLVAIYGWLYSPAAETVPEPYRANGIDAAHKMLRVGGWRGETALEAVEWAYANDVLKNGRFTERFRHPSMRPEERKKKSGTAARPDPFGATALGTWKPAPRVGRDIEQAWTRFPDRQGDETSEPTSELVQL